MKVMVPEDTAVMCRSFGKFQGGCGPSARHIGLVGRSVEKVTKNNFAGPSKLAPVHPILSYKGQFKCQNDQEKLQSLREASQSKEM